MGPALITHVLGAYALLALSLMLTLFLFVSAKAELRAVGRKARQDREALGLELAATHAALEEVRAAVISLQESVQNLDEASGALVPPAAARSGLNLTVRSHVLRRYRRGEQPAAIAASLALPRSEVDLLLKVNRIVLENVI